MGFDIATDWHAAIRLDQLPAGEMISFEAKGCSIAIYNVEGELYATQNICSHAYAVLTDGWLDGEEIECPLHGGRFNVKCGKALTSPATKDIATYPVRVVDGTSSTASISRLFRG
ncbi:non-heme iron oxygenase ferredoxin subunit [Mesorhizobium sp. CA8]|uniref:non-heme iron oxygenase ferredoxin subunit n=1 Tax=unclassified Mesorhizobium TaxID=325217 RepID=UPI001CCB6F94|nr:MULTISPECIES: non-heme iron oxygenase ferredoxin subunit [unclassified Mesorhizobium]MBZ9761673.1 non-heme iron oxygenase ferredoxin subunit [Mesorhizobium sp. CA8]MBZ9820573.1 non-heme iron oxygenase ferredoxin subunit [Mesorhizobium sp. CA4]